MGDTTTTAFPHRRAADRSAPRLTVRVRHRVGALEIDAQFRLKQPWTILFGPSGSGKTTILRAIGGVIRPDEASVVLEQNEPDTPRGNVWVDTADGVFVPPHLRAVRFSAQTAALFPHLTVRQNIRYGIGDARAAEDIRAEETIRRFHLNGIADKWPGELSGGERQRASVARSAAAAGEWNGGVLLLDEPFTGLDAPLRNELIGDLREWLASTRTCVLSVTHDVAEAFQLGAEVIKIAEGKVVAQGPVEVVLAEERERLLRQLGAGDWPGGMGESSEPFLSG